MKTKNAKTFFQIFALLCFFFTATHHGSTKAATVFTCIQDSPEIFGCWFKIKSSVQTETIEFELAGGQSRVFGDEILGRRYCFSSFVEQIIIPDRQREPVDEDLACFSSNILVQKNNTNEYRLDPLPIDKIYFSCGFLFRFGCTFVFDDAEIKYLKLQAGETAYLPASLKGSKYCLFAKPPSVDEQINFILCSATAIKPILVTADRNSEMGSRNEGDIVTASPRKFIPDIILSDPSRLGFCIMTSLPENGEVYYLMTGLFYSPEKKLINAFSGIPKEADAIALASVCTGKWYYQPGEDINKWEKISDVKIPTREGLQSELNKTIRQYKILKNGYVLHVSAGRNWNGPYVEYYFEAKVSSSTDPDGPPVQADELRLDWRHQNTHGTKPCGKNSFCSTSDREYLNLSAPSDDFCAHAVSILEGIALGAETTKGKSCF